VASCGIVRGRIRITGSAMPMATMPNAHLQAIFLWRPMYATLVMLFLLPINDGGQYSYAAYSVFSSPFAGGVVILDAQQLT